MTIISRFAPSPNGYLHLGHAYAAWCAYDLCRAAGGRFLLRIEDIDGLRCRPEYEAPIFEDLAWLGLAWEEPVRRQSDHLADYADALSALQAMSVVYPCYCSRREIREEIASSANAPQGPDGPLYPGTCRGLTSEERAAKVAAGLPAAWRLDIASATARVGDDLAWQDQVAGEQPCLANIQGDVVLARKDIGTSYHLSVVVDDALQGVNLVTRGEDLFASTHVHRLLQALLDYPVPVYHHHRLIEDEHGVRLAKRHGAEPIRDFRARGLSPSDLRRQLGLPIAGQG